MNVRNNGALSCQVRALTRFPSTTQASFTYFVLAYLGYDVRLYDGSFAEWSAAPGTPVARS